MGGTISSSKTHDGRAVVLIPKRSTSPRSDIDAVMVDSLKALDPERPIREADCRDVHAAQLHMRHIFMIQ